jgi:peptidoglycan/LPS O-acetylase OafA/YrhL
MAWGAVLLGLGLLAVHLVDPERYQFLGTTKEMLQDTFFGRFVDFGLGVWGGRLFLSGRVRDAWARRRGTARATAGGVAGIALVFLGQTGMALAGGPDGPHWAVAWPFNLVVGSGSLILILCLTSPASPLSRVLSLAPLVYLGRVSYALYLIQLTPLGKGLLYWLIPQQTPGSVLLLYAGMTLVSALLFELVEEPGRQLVLRCWPKGRRAAASPAPSSTAPGWACVAAVVAAGAVQAASWAGARVQAWQGLPTLAEAQRAVGTLDGRVAYPPVVLRARPDGPSHRVPIPASWMMGTETDRRAPPSLLVYVDGEPVPFDRRANEVASSAVSAHYRRPRTSFVELRMPPGAVPSEVALVLYDPLLAARLLGPRIATWPSLLGGIGITVAGAAAAGWLFHCRRRPRFRVLASGALVASTLFILSGAHEQSWAPLAMAAEVLGLGALAVSGPSARRRRTPV